MMNKNFFALFLLSSIFQVLHGCQPEYQSPAALVRGNSRNNTTSSICPTTGLYTIQHADFPHAASSYSTPESSSTSNSSTLAVLVASTAPTISSSNSSTSGETSTEQKEQ